MQHAALHTTTVQPSSHNQRHVLIGKQWYQLPELIATLWWYITVITKRIVTDSSIIASTAISYCVTKLVFFALLYILLVM